MKPLKLSSRELGYYETIQRVLRNELSRSEAAKLLKITDRHVYRLLARFRTQAERGLVHRLRGGHSNRHHPLTLRNTIALLYKTHYSDYGPTLFCEQLAAEHQIHLDHETARRWLTAIGLWNPKHSRRTHRRYRQPRSHIGAMIQLDGSRHKWFEDRGPEATLIVIIDDASKRVWLRFHPVEDTQGVFETLRDYFLHCGIPNEIYTDFGSVFYDDKDGATQFERAMQQLGIRTIRAHSPQAKGRVERSNRTHQDRLIKAMRRTQIANINEGNAYLQTSYIEDHNRRFARPEGLQDVHRDVKDFNLDTILCFQTTRRVMQDHTITVGGVRWQIEPQRGPILGPRPGAQVTVRSYLDYTMHCFYAEHELNITRIDEHPRFGKERKAKRDNPWRKRVINISTPL
jgi:transposase